MHPNPIQRGEEKGDYDPTHRDDKGEGERDPTHRDDGKRRIGATQPNTTTRTSATQPTTRRKPRGGEEPIRPNVDIDEHGRLIIG